jgi:hypothetical protein
MVKNEVKGKEKCAEQPQHQVAPTVPLDFMIAKGGDEQNQATEKDPIKSRDDGGHMAYFDPYAGKTDHNGPDDEACQSILAAAGL